MTPSMHQRDALLATVYRSGFADCLHYGSVVVVDPGGRVCFSLGAPERQTYGRSANKLMQAVAMLRLGLSVTSEQLALTTASHSGGEQHLDVVCSILADAGLTQEHLQNVAAPPFGRRESEEFLRRDQTPSALTMNCSGKHASMLATCVTCSWGLETYLDPAHPLQVHITETIAEFTGETTDGIGVDGCGAPAHQVSVVGLAQSLRVVALASDTTPEGRVADAIRRHRVLVGGHDRDVTEFLLAAPGWIGKDGADGLMVLASPEGFSVAAKVGDGADRPRVPVALAALEHAGLVLPSLPPAIRRPPVFGGGKPVGELVALG